MSSQFDCSLYCWAYKKKDFSECLILNLNMKFYILLYFIILYTDMLRMVQFFKAYNLKLNYVLL